MPKINSINLTINNVDRLKLKRLIYSMFNGRGLFYRLYPQNINLKITSYYFIIILTNGHSYVFNTRVEDFLFVLFASLVINYDNSEIEKSKYQRLLYRYLMELNENEWYSSKNFDKIDILKLKISKITMVFRFDKFFKQLLQDNVLRDLESLLGLMQINVSWQQIKNFYDYFTTDIQLARANLLEDLRVNNLDPVIQEFDNDPDLNIDPYDYLSRYNFDELRNNFYQYQNNNNVYQDSNFDSSYYVNDNQGEGRTFVGTYIERQVKKIRKN